MAEYRFWPAAGQTYVDLTRSAENFAALDRIEALIEAIAEDSSDVEFRRHRFFSPSCWRVPFVGPDDEEWCLLWFEEGDTVVVLYLGRDRFDR